MTFLKSFVKSSLGPVGMQIFLLYDKGNCRVDTKTGSVGSAETQLILSLFSDLCINVSLVLINAHA